MVLAEKLKILFGCGGPERSPSVNKESVMVELAVRIKNKKISTYFISQLPRFYLGKTDVDCW